jgi:hypothetical protein
MQLPLTIFPNEEKLKSDTVLVFEKEVLVQYIINLMDCQ